MRFRIFLKKSTLQLFASAFLSCIFGCKFIIYLIWSYIPAPAKKGPQKQQKGPSKSGTGNKIAHGNIALPGRIPFRDRLAETLGR
jgi:hypothetical protein